MCTALAVPSFGASAVKGLMTSHLGREMAACSPLIRGERCEGSPSASNTTISPILILIGASAVKVAWWLSLVWSSLSCSPLIRGERCEGAATASWL